MSGSNPLSRRDFIKVTTGVVGGIIGAVFGIPSIGYLIEPALREERLEPHRGKLEDMPVGKSHPFSFTRTSQRLGTDSQQFWRICHPQIGRSQTTCSSSTANARILPAL